MRTCDHQGENERKKRTEIKKDFFFQFFFFFSSPEPKAPGELLVWEASVVRPHFQTTSPLKPLGQI